MISVDIEKEIQQENKVLFGFTLRQVICIAAAGVLGGILVLFVGTDNSGLIMYPFGLLAFLFGWKKWDGLPAERVLLKKIRSIVYHNEKRPYRTKNGYVSLMNAEYQRMKACDLSDKQIAKTVKKEARLRMKQRKKTKMKGIR